MGQVFLVEDLLNGEQLLALKTLRKALLSQEGEDRFKREFRAMTRLRHPNLARVFDQAEHRGWILFFDEADALFGKRSEVKDSHDRYANIEINYLLQRMEAFRGLAILATNMKSALDPAFMRRLRFVVHFQFPGVKERRRIWERALPDDTPQEGLDYDRMARLTVNGGNIHSIALNAAFLAAANRTPVTMPLLLTAARTELRKLERPISEAELR
jgi:SpoVK/Ycf46/Vps4 family AAA+-type ATPase